MNIINIIFYPKRNNSKFLETANEFIWLLERFEHIYKGFIIRPIENKVIATVHAVYSDSLESKYFNRYLGASLKVIHKISHKEVEFISETDKTEVAPALDNIKSLFLETSYLNLGAIFRNGINGGEVPLYLFPIDADIIEQIKFWDHNYQRYDGISMSCHALEIQSYKQIANPKSLLSIEGRKFCKIVENNTKIPTFYFLHRYWGYTGIKEKNRKCPLCGDKWANNNWQDKSKGINKFYFKCVPCKIISEIGISNENPKRAEIGYGKE